MFSHADALETVLFHLPRFDKAKLLAPANILGYHDIGVEIVVPTTEFNDMTLDVIDERLADSSMLD